jgi:hypothetical protein
MFINTNISNLITVLQDCDHDPQKDEAMDLSPQRGMLRNNFSRVRRFSKTWVHFFRSLRTVEAVEAVVAASL